MGVTKTLAQDTVKHQSTGRSFDLTSNDLCQAQTSLPLDIIHGLLYFVVT